jgi:SAM-dependent methyltransferase
MEHSDGYEQIGDYYDSFADNGDLPFYIAWAKKLGSPILDVAAGTCRISIALAKAGYEVVALEKSRSMMDAALRKISSLPNGVADRINLVEGDMTEFSLNRKFPLIIIPTSFGHALTTNAQLNTLRCIKNHLSDDGMFILELFPGAVQNEWAKFEEGPKMLDDGRRVIRKGELKSDFLKQIMTVKLEYLVTHNDGSEEKIDVNSDVAIIYNREADLLLRLVGFLVVHEYGSFDSNPYDSESARRILILKKNVE